MNRLNKTQFDDIISFCDYNTFHIENQLTDSYSPIPISGVLNIEVIEDATKEKWTSSKIEFSVSIYDSDKNLVLTQKGQENKIEINTEKLEKGIYIMQIVDKNKKISEQIMIE